MNKHLLRAALKTIDKDLQDIHQTDCLGCAHLAAARAARLTVSLLHMAEQTEQQPFDILRIVPLDENGQEGA